MGTGNIIRMATEAFTRCFPDVDAVLQNDTDKPVLRVMNKNYPCIINQNLTIGEAAKLEGTTNNHKNRVLYVLTNATPKLQAWFIDMNLNFIDCAGNCNIRYKKNDKVVFALTNKGEPPIVIEKTKNYPVFRKAGLKVVFYLLQNKENVNHTFRMIQEYTGVALGTIKNVIDGMIAANLVKKDNRTRHIVNYGRLVNLWAMNYNLTLKPELFKERMTFRDKDARRDWQNLKLPQGLYWGGEPAAALADKYLDPGDFTIYTDVPAAHLMKTGMVRPDPEGEIYIYKTFWHQDPEDELVPLLLTYADLIETGNGRLAEVAQRLKTWD